MHLAVVATACLPARRNDAVNRTIRGRSSASTRVISPFSKISRTRAGPPGLSADTSTVVASISRQDRRVMQHRVRRPCEFGEVAHQFTPVRLWPCSPYQAQRAKKARFEETPAINVTVNDARRCEGRRLHLGKPGEARFMDADHLLGSKRLPGAVKVGAHLTALTQPHGVRENRVLAYGTPGKGLDDRRNRGRRQFGYARVFETGEYRVSPPAERGRCQQMSQQQTPPSNKRQNLQSRPHAGEGGQVRTRGWRRIARPFIFRAYMGRLKMKGRGKAATDGALHFTPRKLLAPCRLRPPSLSPMLMGFVFLRADPGQSVRSLVRIFLTRIMAGSPGCGMNRELELLAHLQHRLVLAQNLADEFADAALPGHADQAGSSARTLRRVLSNRCEQRSRSRLADCPGQQRNAPHPAPRRRARPAAPVPGHSRAAIAAQQRHG